MFSSLATNCHSAYQRDVSRIMTPSAVFWFQLSISNALRDGDPHLDATLQENGVGQVPDFFLLHFRL